MKLERFAYFLAVAQTGSITLGAQKSFITQTAMSQQMAALEAELGMPLLKRSKSGTSLTEAGQALVPMAEQLVQCYQAIETFADTQRHQPRTLTIVYTGPMEQQLLLRAIPAFRAHHPEVELRVRQLSMARIGAALEAGDCDIALAIPGEIPLQQMKHVTVMERPICAAVASSHPLAGKNSVTLPELTHFPVILLQAGANRRASSQIARWLMGLGWTKDALRFADTIEDQLLMINLNQGISFMPAGQLSRRHPPDSHRQRHADSPPHRGGHAPDDAAAPAIRRAASSGGHGGAASISSAYDEKENACLTFLSQSSMIQA